MPNGPLEFADFQGIDVEPDGSAAEAEEGRFVRRVEIFRPMHDLGDVVALITRLVAVEFAGCEEDTDTEIGRKICYIIRLNVDVPILEVCIKFDVHVSCPCHSTVFLGTCSRTTRTG